MAGPVKEIRWRLEAALFLGVSFAVSLLPLPVALSFGRGLGRLFFRLVASRRKVAIDNVEKSLPYLRRQPGFPGGSAEELARATFENLGRSVAETCKLYHGRGRKLIDAVEFRGVEHYRAAAAKGKGIAFVTAHCGNWELMALAFGARYGRISVVARRQDNPQLNKVTERIRRSFGNGIIYRDGALRQIFASLKRQETVGMLIDQAPQPSEGVLVEFLGRPAWTIRLPALISRKSGAPLLPIFVHREGERHVVTIYPEYTPAQDPDAEAAELKDATAIVRSLERYIVEHPSQWYWVHKRWKRAPERMPKTAETGESDAR